MRSRAADQAIMAAGIPDQGRAQHDCDSTPIKNEVSPGLKAASCGKPVRLRTITDAGLPEHRRSHLAVAGVRRCWARQLQIPDERHAVACAGVITRFLRHVAKGVVPAAHRAP